MLRLERCASCSSRPDADVHQSRRPAQGLVQIAGRLRGQLGGLVLNHVAAQGLDQLGDDLVPPGLRIADEVDPAAPTPTIRRGPWLVIIAISAWAV